MQWKKMCLPKRKYGWTKEHATVIYFRRSRSLFNAEAQTPRESGEKERAQRLSYWRSRVSTGRRTKGTRPCFVLSGLRRGHPEGMKKWRVKNCPLYIIHCPLSIIHLPDGLCVIRRARSMALCPSCASWYSPKVSCNELLSSKTSKTSRLRASALK